MTRVLAVADSDSYLKWSMATLATMPAEWDCRQAVLATPVQPSPRQIQAAAGRDIPPVSAVRLLAELVRRPPDVLLLACTGPAVEALTALPGVCNRRTVLVTGLPGLSVPATAMAVQRRARCDLFLVHSRREQADFAALAAELTPGLQVGLARLPFLTTRTPDGVGGDDVVFAAQAVVPPEPEQRAEILRALARVQPHRSTVVKLRGTTGEPQTHQERHAYPDLWAVLAAAGEVALDSVRFETGPMVDALSRARGLVTVSSTAALEAMAQGVDVLVLSDFGVSAEMINLVFEGSGCLGTLADLEDRRFYAPEPGWLADNYFHPDSDSDWLRRLDGLLARRDGPRPHPRPMGASGSELPAPRRIARTLRRQARILLPPRLWSELRRRRT